MSNAVCELLRTEKVSLLEEAKSRKRNLKESKFVAGAELNIEYLLTLKPISRLHFESKKYFRIVGLVFPKSIHSAKGWLIAKRIAELRGQRGLTQRDLARLLGREHGLVSRIETCERRVELVELIQIFIAIGCDVEVEVGRLVGDLLEIDRAGARSSRKVSP